ncbi:laccase-15-like [Phragmites australis]|uniref:laccase-15-like n=1 Tax=Phragmites australis TaxID=29695 RepID=UPI002D77E688|nr:laccase-15-like [Phragmites australis]XP_062225119.1 laccase-15-like [Phragmites australis]XP_062225120.1 laccase-15-like [Phragmites australis]
MKRRSLPAPSAVVAAAAVVFCLSAAALPPTAAAVVEHTFIVSQVNMTHLCKETLVAVVNGQLPGPTIEVTEGDSVAVHVVNKSPYNMTIHWHGVKQWLNCWADGVPKITQCPILPNHNFTYRFDVAGQEGTLWWHAHVPCLRATVHGALVIRPRLGPGSYPFPMPHKEIPIIIGEWWQVDLAQVGFHLKNYMSDDYFSASTINGKLGDSYNCSGAMEDGYVLDVEPRKTYLLRVINAALFSEYYLKIAGHKFTVVAADANYVSPYTTDVLAIAPGETVDALVVTDAHPGRYYMVALPSQAPKPDPQSPVFISRGTVQYSNSHIPGNGAAVVLSSFRGEEGGGGGGPADDVPAVAPEMPDTHDSMTSFYFRGNLTNVRRPSVPTRVDERLFITLGLSSVCRRGQSCKKSDDDDNYMVVATMNNISFQLPEATTPLLQLHYYNISGKDTLQELPDRPPTAFNYTDRALIRSGPKEAQLEPTSKGTMARRFRQGASVEVVFQSTAMMQSESNPMHLHGHDMFVLAQGHGNYDAAKDVASYNLVDPPARNTVQVPRLGWVAVRFVADNPGIWFMHCHFEFHLSMGMAALFIVEDGPTVDTSLPPPPADILTCDPNDGLMPNEFYLQTKESEVPNIDGV